MINSAEIFRVPSAVDLRKLLGDHLAKFEDLFPRSPDARILVKPNLNSNMNALTGNTTDLRVLAAILEFLKEKGYRNVTVGEGNNSGFHHAGISVIRRLKVDRLAEHYGIDCVDFNSSDFSPVPLEGGMVANVAKECLEAEFFINVPKIKTHYETEMTVCLKSLIGCLVGRENKKKAHSDLIRNILKLNEAIRPDLHVVDGLIAMEGNGPSLGTPKKTDVMMIGTDPYLLDMMAARFAGYDDFQEIPVLREAVRQKKITDAHLRAYHSQRFDGESLRRPRNNLLVALAVHPRVQKHLITLRYAPGIKQLFDRDITRKILFKMELSQDLIITDECGPVSLKVNDRLCPSGCVVCREACPLENDLPAAFGDDSRVCVDCLYCYSVCPTRAIAVEGDIGFFKQQLKQYDKTIRKLFVK